MKKRGFSLVEAALVMGVVGLVMGGVWMTLSSVRNASMDRAFLQQTVTLAQNVRTYFATRHRYHGDFSVERHQGWIKFVTGKFGSYAEARDQRVAFNAAGHAFPGPFVTAYNNGERISVQEALVLSNQKWVQ